MAKDELVVTLKLGDDTERLLKRLFDKHQDAVLKAIASLRIYVGKKFMALTAAQAAAVQGLTDQIAEIDRSVDAAFEAATTNNQALKDHIAQLTVTIDAMTAADTEEDAAFTQQIADLAAARDLLQADLNSQESDVLAALSGVADKLSATDAHVDSLGGTPPPVDPPVDPAPQRRR